MTAGPPGSHPACPRSNKTTLLPLKYQSSHTDRNTHTLFSRLTFPLQQCYRADKDRPPPEQKLKLKHGASRSAAGETGSYGFTATRRAAAAEPFAIEPTTSDALNWAEEPEQVSSGVQASETHKSVLSLKAILQSLWCVFIDRQSLLELCKSSKLYIIVVW